MILKFSCQSGRETDGPVIFIHVYMIKKPLICDFQISYHVSPKRVTNDRIISKSITRFFMAKSAFFARSRQAQIKNILNPKRLLNLYQSAHKRPEIRKFNRLGHMQIIDEREPSVIYIFEYHYFQVLAGKLDPVLRPQSKGAGKIIADRERECE